MAIQDETEQEREKRRYRRTLFDQVADLYDATRRGYPPRIVELIATTAGLNHGSSVLEIGCGTGQLTESLARLDPDPGFNPGLNPGPGPGLDLTAIDIGPSMIEVAQRRLAAARVAFEVTSFEDFAAPDGSFDLIACGSAFHWIDPEVRFRKSSRLLRPGGWLAVVATLERYDDPFGAALREMWIARSEDGGAWLHQRQPSTAEVIADSGLFEAAIRANDRQRLTLPVETVVGVENTRATSLSWPAAARAEFSEEIRRHLRGQAQVELIQETVLTMAATRPAKG